MTVSFCSAPSKHSAQLLKFFANSRSENCTDAPGAKSALMLEKRCYKNSNSHHAELRAQHKHATTCYYAVCPGVKIWMCKCASATFLSLWTREAKSAHLLSPAKSENSKHTFAGLDTVALIPRFPWKSPVVSTSHIKHLTWPRGHQQQTHCWE